MWGAPHRRGPARGRAAFAETKSKVARKPWPEEANRPGEARAARYGGEPNTGAERPPPQATGGADQEPDLIEEVHRVANIAGEKLHAALSVLLPELPAPEDSAGTTGGRT